MKRFIFFLLATLIISVNAIASEISIVDVSYLLTNSNKGKLIKKDLDSLKSKNVKNFNSRKKKLEDKEKKIASKKNVLSEEDFKKEVELFKKEVNKFNEDRRKSNQEMSLKRNNKIAKLLEEINKILIEYSAQNSISTIVDKKNVIITKEENDITKNILKILNK